MYDSVGRRIGSDDPDTDSRDPEVPASARSWRYLFNVAGDLIAVRDPRGCGQNFFYDLGGRLLGEQYVSCSEAQSAAAELPTETLGDAVAQEASLGARTVDVRYFYDASPEWIGLSSEHEPLEVALPASHPAAGIGARACEERVSGASPTT